jgi:outer membrane protein assembly factor BamA
LSIATRTVRGGSVFGIWPLNRYRRLELVAGVLNYNEQFNDPALEAYSQQYQTDTFGRQLFRSGTYVPLGINFVQETTVFREFGPLSGSTMRMAYEFAPKIGNTLSRQTIDADARYYMRLGASGLLALRARGFQSWGDAPDFMYFGGNSEMRGYDYLQFVGEKAAFFNAELRFPLIEAMLTPVGVLGGIRGVFFANMGGGHFDGQQFKWWSSSSESYTPINTFVQTGLGQQSPVYGTPEVVDGFRLVDARASYGIGLETFALGFPIHFDWAWKTLFNKQWEDLLFRPYGGSSAFRKAKFSVWIGYDF